jgi:enamine deaminase RidA (YjgF/YER057c/UK114 family)
VSRIEKERDVPVRFLNPDGVPAPAGQYSHVALADGGSFAFVAGQVSLGADGELIGSRDVASQFRQVFENLSTILERSGSDFTQIVNLTTYLVGADSLEEFRVARMQVFERFFPDGGYPPNTLVVVSALAHPDVKV